MPLTLAGANRCLAWRIAPLALIAGLLFLSLPTLAQPPVHDVDVAIFAINDLHGNLLPPAGGISILDPADAAKRTPIAAGGVERMATLIKQLRAKNRYNIFVAAGDLIGASPLLSGVFHDEPTVEALSLMGLEASAVGNHEFDNGLAELRRIQNGGCHPADGCNGPSPFTGAKFHYLAASTVDKATGKTIFPPYYVKRFEGIPVAFIGLTLEGTPALVTPAAAKGLEFRDEAETVNALVPELQAKGIHAIVVLIHQGGTPQGNSADYNGCPGFSGPIAAIVPKLDKAVNLVISGHTHQAYNCVIDGRLVTSAHRYGTMVTEIHLKLDAATHDVKDARAENLIVRTDNLAKDPEQTKLIAFYQQKAAPIANRVVGRLSDPLSPASNAAGESALGDVLADGELAATKDSGAVIGFINSGGIRSSLGSRPGENVTRGDLFAVQPFGNCLVTLTLSGAQIKAALEEQWSNSAVPVGLQISRGLSYTWDMTRPAGDRVVPGSLMLDGAPIRPEAFYRVALVDFLADGAGGFDAFKAGTDRRPVMIDLDATEAYFRANNPMHAPTLDRVRRLN